MSEVINIFKALDFTTNRKFYLIGKRIDGERKLYKILMESRDNHRTDDKENT